MDSQAHTESAFEKYRIVQDRLFESDFDKRVKAVATDVPSNHADREKVRISRMHSLAEKNKDCPIAHDWPPTLLGERPQCLVAVLSIHGHLGVATDNQTPDAAAGGLTS